MNFKVIENSGESLYYDADTEEDCGAYVKRIYIYFGCKSEKPYEMTMQAFRRYHYKDKPYDLYLPDETCSLTKSQVEWALEMMKSMEWFKENK